MSTRGESASSDANSIGTSTGGQSLSKPAPLKALQLLAYSAPVCATIFLWNPTVSILPGLYAKYFGLSLTAVASVLFIARVVDAIVDPIAGYLSDRHRMAGGSRKTWVIAGGAALCGSAYFLFTPPVPATFAYYLSGSLAFYLSWTVFDIPHFAWGAELVGDYKGRALIYGYRGVAIYVGLIAFAILPFLPIFASTVYTPDTLRFALVVGATFMLVMLAFSVSLTPEGRIATTQAEDSFRSVCASVFGNRPLLHFIATYVCFSLSYGMWSGFIFIYLDSYLNLGSWTAVIFLVFSIGALLSIPIWVKAVAATSKTVVLAAGIALHLVSLGAYVWVTPETTWWIPLLASCGVHIGVAAFALITPALLADVVDYGTLVFKRNRASTYFAFLTLAFKTTSGLGAGIVLALIGYFGFDATASTQSETAVRGVRLAFIALPALLAVAAFILAIRTPITQHRHEVIRRRIESRSGVRNECNPSSRAV